MSETAKRLMYNASRIFRISQIKNSVVAEAKPIMEQRGTPEQMAEWREEIVTMLMKAHLQIARLEAGDATKVA